MSNFVKPSTPTKIRSNIRTLTPTKSKSLSSINTSGDCSNSGSTSHNFAEKISEENLYLYLEALKRNLDNEIILKQKVEEAYRAFEERRNKHFSLVAKYAALLKLAYTRKALLSNDLLEISVAPAQEDAKVIKEKLSSGTATDYINSTELSKFKNMLHQMGKYENLPIKRSEIVDFQNATDAIRYSIEAIEKSLEKCTIQGLDHFTNSLDMENFPKLLSENNFNDY